MIFEFERVPGQRVKLRIRREPRPDAEVKLARVTMAAEAALFASSKFTAPEARNILEAGLDRV